MLKRLFETQDSLPLLVARVALAVVFFPHGAQKVLGWWGGGGFSATLQAFAQMGMPAALVVLIMAAEFLGAFGLLFGFVGRFCAFGIGCVMVGAVALVHGQHGFFMNWFGNQAGEGFEYHILALGLALAVLIGGSGKGSLDRALAEKLG